MIDALTVQASKDSHFSPIASQKTILVADDDAVSLEIVKTTLQLLRPEPRLLTATDGTEAIRFLNHESIDIVVTDIRMPGADGLQVLAHVVNQRLRTPVIAISGQSTPELRADVLDSGACMLLEKPVSPSHLTDSVQHLLVDDSRSYLKGFNLASILQLIEMELKSCEVSIQDEEGNRGLLVFLGGRLVHAKTEAQAGDAAARQILSWLSPRVDIQERTCPRVTTVTGSLTQIMLESARLEDLDNLPSTESHQELHAAPPQRSSPLEEENQQNLFAKLSGLDGFVSASIIDIYRCETLLAEHRNASKLCETTQFSILTTVCRMIEAERELASNDPHNQTTDMVVRLGSSWHLLRGITDTCALHLTLEQGSNAALAQYQLNRWVPEACGAQGGPGSS